MAAAGDEVISRRAPNGAELRAVLILGVKGEGLKGNMSLYSEEALNSGKLGCERCGKYPDEPDWDSESSGVFE